MIITLSITLFVICCVIAVWIWWKTPPENPSELSTPKDPLWHRPPSSSLSKPFDSSSLKPNESTGAINVAGQSPWLSKLLAGAFGKSIVHTKIVVNGQDFSNPEQMPPEARRAYEDTMRRVLSDSNHNGIPDIFEGDGSSGLHLEMKNLNSETPANKLKQLNEMKESGSSPSRSTKRRRQKSSRGCSDRVR